MTVVPREGLERVLTVEEDDGVLPRAEKVLGGGRATGSGGEIVEEADAARGSGEVEGSEGREGRTRCARGEQSFHHSAEEGQSA